MASIIKVDQIQTAAGGTPTAADLGLNTTGSVLQVVQTVDQRSAHWFTSSSSYVTAGDNLQVSITPTSTSSKILVAVTMFLHTQSPVTIGKCSIYRDSTNLATNTQGDFTQIGIGGDNSPRLYASVAMQILDAPSTTSQLTYYSKVRRHSGTGNVYLHEGAVNTITAIEIAG